VADIARILDAYAGFDPADELTAFSTRRTPAQPYGSSANRKRLDGHRIGVIREYMDKSLFTIADAESIDRFVPKWHNQQFSNQFPAVFPQDAAGAPIGDHITTLLDMFSTRTSCRTPPPAGRASATSAAARSTDTGDGRYNLNAYIRERGDSAIRSLTDLVEKANFWTDPVLQNRKSSLQSTDRQRTPATASTQQTRFTVQTVVYQCFAELDLDAVVYPSGNIPPGSPPPLLPAKTAALPVGIDFLGLPFTEPKLFEIASAYESATHHRAQPAEFGPLDE
jgi:Asp-tRNA(Asn)/Glu-tRNA(Gln) amidotransferase A subunit family amidase